MEFDFPAETSAQAIHTTMERLQNGRVAVWELKNTIETTQIRVRKSEQLIAAADTLVSRSNLLVGK